MKEGKKETSDRRQTGGLSHQILAGHILNLSSCTIDRGHCACVPPNAAKTKLNLYADASFLLPLPPPRPDFPWRTDCDSQHSIMVRRAAAFKAQIDVSDIIVSLHKTVGRGSRGRSLAGGSGSKLTVVCNIKHFPDPQARR